MSQKREPRFSRSREISRLRARLHRDEFPRFQMSSMVGGTGAVGLLASYVLLNFGLTSMPVRYALALAVAYGFFLWLLRVWMSLREETTDVVDEGRDIASGDSPDFEALEGAGEALEAVAQADEFAIPLFLLMVVGAVALSSLWVVWSAPTLFAELLVDGVLSASLYHRLRGLETRSWIETAVRRTLLPFVLTLLLLVGGGFALEHLAPGAHTLGQVLEQLD